MIHPSNNDYDLEAIEVWTKEPFAIGDTRIGRASSKNWLVHWVDETTLAIAPEHAPTAWRPAHIYSNGGYERNESGKEMWGFVLVPSERERVLNDALTSVREIDTVEIQEAIGAIEDVIGVFAQSKEPDPLEKEFGSLGAKLHEALDLVGKAKAEAEELIAAHGPPSTDEPCKLTPRSRR